MEREELITTPCVLYKVLKLGLLALQSAPRIRTASPLQAELTSNLLALSTPK